MYMWLNEGWQFSKFSLTSATRGTPWSDTPDLSLQVPHFSISKETWMVFRWIWKREWSHSGQLPPLWRYVSSEQVFLCPGSWALQNLHLKQKQAFVPTASDLGAEFLQSQRDKSMGPQVQTSTLALISNKRNLLISLHWTFAYISHGS